MAWPAWMTLIIVAGVLVALMTTSTPQAIILSAAVGILLVAGVLTPTEALGGLANEGMVTIGVLFVVGAGVRETGAIDWVATRLLGRPGGVGKAITRLCVPTAALSAFVNNTPLVAMLIPLVGDWAKQNRIAVSKLMLPLSYAAVLGGTCSLIGTSTNLVVDGFLRKSTGQAMGMFDIAWVGLPCTLAGCAFMVLAHRRLLPDRRPALSQLEDPRQYTVEMTVDPDSPLVGQTIEQAGLRHLPGVYLAEIDRQGQVLAAVSPSERLLADDRLVFVGIVESVVDLQRTRGLTPATDQVFKLTAPRETRCLMEAVVSDSCPLVGKSIRDARFRTHYNAVVLAVARNGERINSKIGDIVLRPGDTLLVEGHPTFLEQHRNSRDFFLVSQLEDSHPRQYHRGPLALAILGGMVLAVSLGQAPLVAGLVGEVTMLKAALVAAALMIALRCVTPRLAAKSLDGQVLLAIAAAFGIGEALAKTGAARAFAERLIDLAGGSPWWSLVAIYLVTTIVTELITNNAAAALMFPLAMATASRLEVNHMPFIIALMIAASAAFATPMGYQTNLMVYGPGGYKFSDYLRMGLLLDVLMAAITVSLAPLIWPF